MVVEQLSWPSCRPKEDIMTPDPTTEEGMKIIAERIKKRKADAVGARKRALTDIDDEPTGKLTNPNEMDLYRDRKNNDE